MHAAQRVRSLRVLGATSSAVRPAHIEKPPRWPTLPHERTRSRTAWLVTGLVLSAAWSAVSAAELMPPDTLPTPFAVAAAFRTELASGRLATDAIASMYRVAVGYGSAVVFGVPIGIFVGRSLLARAALLPWVNFFRSLSPIAWIPLAITWFGIGDPPAVFIIFLATFFQLVLATAAAAAAVPSVYYRAAADLGLNPRQVMFHVTLPAILPQLMTVLRVAIGIAWMVVVAAEMVAVQSGLGYLILDARNGLRMDLVVCGMISIGAIGVGLDVVFVRLARAPSLGWGCER